MKSYIDRLLHSENSPKKWEICLWWAARGVLIVTLIHALFIRKDTLMALQVTGNLLGQFVWEVLMMFPKKSFTRYIPAYIQDYSSVGLIGGSLFGAYLNFYYSMPVLDIVMHSLGGVVCTLIGYEIITAMEKRDIARGDTPSSIPVILIGALGISFIAGNLWELFEFTADQLNPSIGDAQHWSYQLAIEADLKDHIGLPNFIPHRDIMRYAIMDTMEDMICNTVGGFVGWIILKFVPYHHLDRNKKLKETAKKNS